MERLEPQQKSYLFEATAFAITLIVLATTISVYSIIADTGIIGLLPAAILLGLLVVWYQRGKFNRESYEVRGTSFRMQRGSWFTSQDITIQGKKVTDIELRRGFLQRVLFGTGDIHIQTAGGGDSEILFQDVNQPRKLFETVLGVLRNSGHDLKCDTIQKKSSPEKRGAVLGALGSVGGLLGFLLVVAGNLLTILPASIALLAATGVIAVGFVVGVWTYLDQVKRTYTVFDDAVEVQEGWLTRHKFVIPGEKLSDSKTSQGLLDRILGLHTVTVSSKGSGGEFKLLHLANATAVQDALDAVEASMSELADYEGRSDETEEGEAEDSDSARTGTSWSLQPDVNRAAVPWLVLGLIGFVFTLLSLVLPFLWFGIWMAGAGFGIALFQGVIYMNTEYEITDESVSSTFDFIVSNRTHFSFEKVTGVVEKRSPVDWLMGTKQLVFWSIGSDATLGMRHLDVDDEVLDDVLAKHGVNYEERLTTFTPSFDLATFLVAFFPVHIPVVLGVATASALTPFGVLSGVAAILVYGVVFAYLTFYYRRARIDVHSDALRVSRGILYRTTHHLDLDDVKDISSTTYPLVSAGSITFNAAGERVVQTDNGKQSMPYQTGVRFISDVRDVHGRVDDVILERPNTMPKASPEREFTVSDRPSLKNLFVLAGVLLPLTLVFFWLLPYFVWRRRCMWYGLSSNHVVARKGIFFQEETTIRYSRIDHVNQVKGWRNKVCGNTSIQIETTGSSSAEVTIQDVNNHQAFSDEIQRYR
jgi:membrane protein YdbS with pleckstrin-like domain